MKAIGLVCNRGIDKSVYCPRNSKNGSRSCWPGRETKGATGEALSQQTLGDGDGVMDDEEKESDEKVDREH